MVTLANILQNKDFKPQTKILLKWQERAYQVWKTLHLNKKELGSLFRFFKYHHEQDLGKIEQAYSFTADYEGCVPKLKLFYWKFYQLKKAKK